MSKIGLFIHQKKLRIILITLAMLMLFVGGMIYILFRKDTLIMFGWFDHIGLTPLVQTLRGYVVGVKPSRFVLGALPDALWLAAYLLIVNALFLGSNRYLYLFWILLMPVLAIIHETLQHYHLVPGSFDYADMGCYVGLLALNLVFYFYYFYFRRR